MGKKKKFINYAGMSFPDLEDRILSHRRMPKNSDFWAVIDQNPLDTNAVRTLIGYGWIAEYRSLGSKDYGLCIVDSKVLAIDHLLRKNGLERDVTLAHEAIHAYFWESGFELGDGENDKRSQRNYMAVEWLARKARSNPYILRALIEGFGFQPLVYDQVSRRAFVRTVLDEVVIAKYSTYQQLSLGL